jgi:hypothetical protein
VDANLRGHYGVGSSKPMLPSITFDMEESVEKQSFFEYILAAVIYL